MKEATILINNVLLDEAQSSSLRVAVASFLTELAEPDHMSALGEIGPLYQARLSEVQDLIFKGEAERRARALAEKKHAGQTYNGGRDPYTVHLDAVHDLAERVGLPEPLLVAAYLHDVLEDTPVKQMADIRARRAGTAVYPYGIQGFDVYAEYEELKDRFGAQVADLVEAVTGRGKTRRERNADAYQKIIALGPSAALLKMCDRCINASFSKRLVLDGGTPDYFNLYRDEQGHFMEMIQKAMVRAGAEQRRAYEQLCNHLETSFS